MRRRRLARLGTFAFPEQLRWLLEATAVVASETFTSTSAPIQFAAITAFAGGAFIDRYLAQCRRILRALGGHCAAVLREAGLDVHSPDGAFYLFPDFHPLASELTTRGISTSRQLCQRLLADTGVATVPGAACGRVDSELTLRMAYVDFDGASALDASGRTDGSAELDEAFLRRYCPCVTEAMDRVAQWLREGQQRQIG